MSYLTRLSLVNRLVVALLSIAVVIFGVVALTTLKQELHPVDAGPRRPPSPRRTRVRRPRSSPTRSPIPIEQAVRSVTGVTKVSSTSTTGSTTISVEWDYGLNDDKVLADINNAINSVKPTLPDEVTTNVRTGSSDDIPVLQLAVASDLPLTKLGPLVEDRVVDRSRPSTACGRSRSPARTPPARGHPQERPAREVRPHRRVRHPVGAEPAEGHPRRHQLRRDSQLGRGRHRAGLGPAGRGAAGRHREAWGQAPRPAGYRQGSRDRAPPRSRGPTAGRRSVSSC